MITFKNHLWMIFCYNLKGCVMNKILLIEDNYMIVKAIVYLLKQNNFDVVVSNNLSDSLNYLSNNIDIVILDLMLPDGDGLVFYKTHLKNKHTIILTAKDDEDIVVDAIDSGVDEYIIKPFRAKELVSRINKIIRKKEEKNIIQKDNIIINLDSSQVFVNNNEVYFTSLEYKILILLFQNFNRVITRDILIDRIWDITGKIVNDNTLSVYIKRIREKLNNDSIIKTIKGIGYRVDK